MREDGDGGDEAADDGGWMAVMAMAMRTATRVIMPTINGQWQTFALHPLKTIRVAAPLLNYTLLN